MKRLLFVGMLLMACSGQPFSQDSISIRVINESYEARRVRIYCDGFNVTTLRTLQLNAPTDRTIRVSSCRQISYRVETINQAWAPPDLVLINPGDTLEIIVKDYLPLTYHRVRQEGTP